MTRIHDTWADSDAPLTLEIYYSGAWHDITADLSEDGWQITRNPPEPTEFTCRLDNSGGKYSPRNPLSVLYGLVGRNTPIRAKVIAGGVTHTRFYGEVSVWPQRWTTKGTAYAPIAAAGIRRRLGQGASPLHSAMRRGAESVTDLIAYWPCEEGAGATSIASGLPGGPPMAIAGTPRLAADSETFIASNALPAMGSGSFTARIPAYTSTGKIQVRCLCSIPDRTLGGITDGATILTLRTAGTAARFTITYKADGILILNAYDAGGTLLGTSGEMFGLIDGFPFRLGLQLSQSGGNVTWAVEELGPGYPSGGSGTGTFTGVTIGSATEVSLATSKNCTDVVMGQLTVQKTTTTLYDLYQQLNAYQWETVANRLTRLYGVTTVGTTTQYLGWERIATLLDVMDTAAKTDGGILMETRDAAGFTFRSLDSITAQDAAATIAYTDNLLLPFEPVDDDKLTRNKVTVTRDRGSQYTSEVTTGPLNVSDPVDDPEGVGVYDEAFTLSLADDTQASDQATWRTHLGTTDESRWPRIGIELAHPTLRADSTLTADVLGMDVGDRLVVTLPAATAADLGLPPDNVDQLVVGYVETVTPKRFTITANGVPYSPYRVAVYDDAASFYSGAGTVLAEDLDTTETGIDVTAPAGVTWAHDDGDYVLAVGGETMTVTAISGTAPNYTFTVTRSTNGIVKTHSTGAPIDLAFPVFYSL